MNEKDFFTGHIKDLANRSYNNSIYTFSDFLGEAEIDMLMSMERELGFAGMQLFGGIENASRLVARFGKESDLGYTQDFPIACIKSEPLLMKFGEELNHRDYLGALMNLGIERQLIGDIMVSGKTAYIFCLEHIAPFILESISQIRHTNVKLSLLDSVPEDLQPHFEDIALVISSERLDAIIAKLFNLSRSQSSGLFHGHKIFVNGRQCENTSFAVKNNDRISVRGYGKFIYRGSTGITGKGRYRVLVSVYK